MQLDHEKLDVCRVALDFVARARRSAVECAAVFAIVSRLRLAEPRLLPTARNDVVRVVGMLVRLIRGCGREPGHGRGHGQRHGGSRALRATRS